MKKKIFIFIALIIIIFFLNKHFNLSSYISSEDSLNYLKEMVKDNILKASIIYIALTIVGCVVLALPGATFAIFSGIIFGPYLGILLCLIATTIGASLAFLVGRFFLKDAVKPMLEKNKYLKRILFSENDKSDMIILMITRMVPLFPYNLQNFAYGITNINFLKYTIYTFIFMFPGVSFITIASAGLTASSNKWIYFAVSALICALVTFIGIFIQRKYVKK